MSREESQENYLNQNKEFMIYSQKIAEKVKNQRK